MTESIGAPITISETSSQPKFGVTDVLLFMMAAIWGINFVVVKYATGIFSPVAFTGLRVATVAVFLVLVALSRNASEAKTANRGSLFSRVSRGDALRLLLLGVLGNGIYQLFFVHGVSRTRAGNAALIVGAAPAFIALVARARGLERVKRMSLVGIGLSVLGVALVIVGSATSSSRGEATLLGSVLVFFGVLCWTWYTILLQPYATRIDVIQLSAVTM